MGLIDQLKSVLGLGPQQAAVVYPSFAYAAPVPARVPISAAMGPTDDMSLSDSASLVSSSSHKSGTSNDNRSSLVSGR